MAGRSERLSEDTARRLHGAEVPGIALSDHARRLPARDRCLAAAGRERAAARTRDPHPHSLLSAFRLEAGRQQRAEPELLALPRHVRGARLCGRGRRRARHRRELRRARQLPLAQGARRLPRDRRLGGRAGLVGRTDRLDRHLVSRRRLDLPRQHRASCRQGHRAAVRRLGHLHGSLLSGRRSAQSARIELRRADGRARP